MKKLIKLIACIGLVFAVGGCSKETNVNDDALDKIEAGIHKFAEVKSMSYEMSVTEDTTKTNLKIAGAMTQTNEFVLSLAADMSAEENPMQRLFELYVKEKNLYFSFIGIKQKQAFSESDVTTSTNSAKDFKINKENANKYLEEAVLDGNKVILKLKTDDLNKQLKDTTSTGAEALGATLDSISSITVTINFEDDFISSAVLDLIGKKAEKDINVKAEASLKDINKTDSVTFPDDLDTYPEGDVSDLL